MGKSFGIISSNLIVIMQQLHSFTESFTQTKAFAQSTKMPLTWCSDTHARDSALLWEWTTGLTPDPRIALKIL